MKANETHKMSDAEMTEEVGRLRSQLFELRGQALTEKLENPGRFGALRRDIARILTEQNSRRTRRTSQEQAK